MPVVVQGWSAEECVSNRRILHKTVTHKVIVRSLGCIHRKMVVLHMVHVHPQEHYNDLLKGCNLVLTKGCNLVPRKDCTGDPPKDCTADPPKDCTADLPKDCMDYSTESGGGYQPVDEGIHL